MCKEESQRRCTMLNTNTTRFSVTAHTTTTHTNNKNNIFNMDAIGKKIDCINNHPTSNARNPNKLGPRPTSYPPFTPNLAKTNSLSTATTAESRCYEIEITTRTQKGGPKSNRAQRRIKRLHSESIEPKQHELKSIMVLVKSISLLRSKANTDESIMRDALDNNCLAPPQDNVFDTNHTSSTCRTRRRSAPL
eukprot:m.89576 g.89576  ORF g.89576 m.89576 type:complete len:192 (-) comp26310_c0_seq1:415-990(-)